MGSEWTDKYNSRYPAWAHRIKDKGLVDIVERFCEMQGYKTKQQFGDYLMELFKKDRVEYSYKLKD